MHKVDRNRFIGLVEAGRQNIHPSRLVSRDPYFSDLNIKNRASMLAEVVDARFVDSCDARLIL